MLQKFLESIKFKKVKDIKFYEISGISSHNYNYSEDSINKIKELIPSQKIRFEKYVNSIGGFGFGNAKDDSLGYEKGRRYSDQSRIIATITSFVKEEEFLKDKENFIVSSIKDASESDYWYKHEKEY